MSAKILPIIEMIESNTRDHRYPYDPVYKNGIAFTQGEYRPINEAMVPISDPGFSGADAAYDALCVNDGYIFRLEDHLTRFEESCEKFCLKNPNTRKETKDILINMVKSTGLKDAFIWSAVTRGKKRANKSGEIQRFNDANDYDNQFYAFATDYKTVCTDDQRENGIDIMISKKHTRIPVSSVDSTAKNFLHLDTRMALIEAREEGYFWCVLPSAEGYLTEAPGCNIFAIKDGVVYTPDSNCLEGITRRTVIELCEGLNIPVQVSKVSLETLLTADEAFLTSTAGGVMPIDSVDGNVLGGVKGPGTLTTKLHNLYWKKRLSGWLGTPIDYAQMDVS